MARRGGWRRAGSRRRFRYLDGRGARIEDRVKIERIEQLVIPPAWTDVWISPRADAKLQATGVDRAGRRQYLYHPDFRARQEQAKFDKLVRFAEKLPDCEHMGEEFTAKDFRTWGGTLTAAIGLAEHGVAETDAGAKKAILNVTRAVGERFGNTPAVARNSYVSPAVVEQYLDGRTIEDFRPRKLRIVNARDIGLDPEENALLSLLRSWRIRRARVAA